MDFIKIQIAALLNALKTSLIGKLTALVLIMS